jgi:hypothetical protein
MRDGGLSYIVDDLFKPIRYMKEENEWALAERTDYSQQLVLFIFNLLGTESTSRISCVDAKCSEVLSDMITAT